MMQFTEEQRKALIEDCQAVIEHGGLSSPNIYEIALAALTAKPVGYIHNFLPPDQSGGIFAEENRHYGRAVYTALPVVALRLPDEKKRMENVSCTAEVYLQGKGDGFNEALAEVKRLNATAPGGAQ